MDSGTQSNIYFNLAGERTDSGTRQLKDDHGKMFTSGSINHFLLTVPKNLGELQYLYIWHDSSGLGDDASWFLYRVVVTDMETGKCFHFLCNQWLAVDKGDGKIDRILTVAAKDDVLNYKNRIGIMRQQAFTEDHLWVSLFLRPKRSSFTRVQRLSCCLSMLFAYLISNAMFYKNDSDSEEENMNFTWIHFGPIKFSLQQIYIGSISTLIVFPVNILIVSIFRKTRRYGNRPTIFRRCCNLLNFRRAFSRYSTTIESPDDARVKETSCLMLPYWCLYIAWISTFLVTLASGFFVIMYSMQWGPSKSHAWLTSCLTSFCESVFLIEPIKVLVLAYLFALVMRNPEIDQEYTGNKTIKQEMKQETTNLQHMNLEMEGNGPSRPLRSDEIHEVKLRRTREKQTMAVFYGIIVYMVFVGVTITLCRYVRDPMTYYLNTHLEDTFTNQQPRFNKIRTPDQFWAWMDTVFVPALYKADKNPPTSTADGRHFHIGLPRLRQQRLMKGSCVRNLQKTRFECELVGEIETFDFDIGWKSFEPDTNHTSADSPWKHQDSTILSGIPVWGHHGYYDTTGYVATFQRQISEVRKLTQSLRDEIWIDRFTSVVLVEFDLYNPDSKLLASVTYMVEFLEPGGAECMALQTTFRLLHSVFAGNKSYDNYAITVFISWVLLFALGIVLIVSLVRRLIIQRFVFFKLPWNFFDLTLVSTTFVSLAFMVIFEVNASRVVKNTIQTGKGNLQEIAALSNTLNHILAVDVFLAIFRFLKLLRFNRRMMLLSLTLRKAKAALLSFAIYFIITTCVFSHAGYLLFHMFIGNFKSPIDTASLLFTVTVGKFPPPESLDVWSTLSIFFLIAYAMFTIIITMNIFIAIINDAFVQARKEIDKQKNQFDMLDYLTTRLKAKAIEIGVWTKENKENDKTKRTVDVYFTEIEKKLDKLEKLTKTLH
ncbi:polycystin-1-like protein 2 [Glandiceps talaboti]